MPKHLRERLPKPGPTSTSILTGAFYVLVLLLSFIQQPGRLTNDTRLELGTVPGAFVRGAFRLWHPETTLGEIQNQAYGYLFPQGPFFVLLDATGVPGWVAQRVWTALVLIVAAEGARRVGLRLDLRPPAALLAGAAFALAPRLVGTVGVISAESLPGAVMPWALLPVLASLQGDLPVRRAAVLSAAAVVFMGGVNATEVVGSLSIVLVFVLWGVARRMVRWTLALWWGGAVLIASLWWLLPLLVLVRYSPPFFDFVESAATTTSPVGWLEATRGTTHWVSFLAVGGTPWWPAAFDLATRDWLVVLTTIVSALGLFGLVRLRHPMRTPLALSAALGLLCLTVAHGTWVGSPVATTVRDLLDGPLTEFRNVHKIDPVVRLPLAVGLGALAQQMRVRPFLSALPHVAVGALVLALAQPLLVDHLRTDGWRDLPEHWTSAAEYLRDHDDGRATWVVPGAGFAIQGWGRTLDEPLRAFPDARWVSRSQIPLAPPQTIRVLDGLERVVGTGEGSPELGGVLAELGIGHVLLRRDLDRVQAESPDPEMVARALDRSGGLRLVASFGGSRTTPQVEIYEVVPHLPPVRVSAVGQVATVEGAPEDVVFLRALGLLPWETPAVLVGEPGWAAKADFSADGLQRRERNYGRVYDAEGPVLSAGDPYVGGRPVPDYPGPDAAELVVAQYDGAIRVMASSSQGYVNSLGAVQPEVGPYAAVDGSPTSAWVSSVVGKPVGQWLQVDLSEPTDVHRVTVTTTVGDKALVPVTALRVTAGSRTAVARVDPATGRAVADVDVRDARSVRVTVAATSGGSRLGAVAFRQVEIDRRQLGRSLVVPPVDMSSKPTYLFRTSPEIRACVPNADGYSCNARRQRSSEEADGLSRIVTVPGGTSWEFRGQAVARALPGVADLLDPLGIDQVVRASSVLGEDPVASARSAYDGDPTTSWSSRAEDRAPTLTIGWSRHRTIRGITVRSDDAGAQKPTAVRLTTRTGERRTVEVKSGSATFRPLTTKEVRVTFEGFSRDKGVSISELGLVGVPSFVRPVDETATTGAVCGLGPRIVVDGVDHPSRVIGTIADVRDGDPLTVESCGSPVRLTAGQHKVRAAPTEQFQVVSLVMRPNRLHPRPPADVEQARVRSWSDSRRTVELPGRSSTTSLLSVAENFNRGWQATAQGKQLQPVRVDGWEQGWLVPPGTTGTVTLTFSPQRRYLWGLVAGLVLGGLVLLAAAVLLLRPAQRRAVPRLLPARSAGLPWTVALLGLGLALGGGVLAAGMVVGAVLRRGAPTLGLLLVGTAGALGATAANQTWLNLAEALCATGVGAFAGSLLGPRDRAPEVPDA
jgi:arabinofuranan 3-O-arabinosyltransferase